MDVKTAIKINEVLQNILNNIEVEMCVIDLKYKEEYQPYFDEIENTIIKVSDKFYQDYIHNAKVIKNEKI